MIHNISITGLKLQFFNVVIALYQFIDKFIASIVFRISGKQTPWENPKKLHVTKTSSTSTQYTNRCNKQYTIFVTSFYYRPIWFLKNAETSPLKCNIYLSLFIAILRLFYNALCTLVSSSEKIIIYSCYNHSFQTNEVSLFNVVAFNIALFDVALFQYCIIFTVSCCTFFIVHCLMFPYLMLHYLMMHDFHVVLFVGALFNLYHINILLLNVALFHCCTVSMLHFIILRY